MELKSKLYLVDEEGEKFMGIGVLWLLQKIDACGSLRAAARDLGISYTKAFGMIQNLEKGLGLAVLDRRKGGSGHVGAVLTPFGKEFMKVYDAFQKDAKATLEEPYRLFTRQLQTLMEKEESNEDR